MKIFKTCAVGAILLFGNAHINAYANNNIGLYSNDLAKCMVISLNDNDKRTIQAMSLQMIFSHPNFSQKKSIQYLRNLANQTANRGVTYKAYR